MDLLCSCDHLDASNIIISSATVSQARLRPNLLAVKQFTSLHELQP
jgi:hypothetical protein